MLNKLLREWMELLMRDKIKEISKIYPAEKVAEAVLSVYKK